MTKTWDSVVIGGGAAGLFCAGVAGQLGKKVLVLDHAPVLGEKIRISGGGRCNFTNSHSSPAKTSNVQSAPSSHTSEASQGNSCRAPHASSYK